MWVVKPAEMLAKDNRSDVVLNIISLDPHLKELTDKSASRVSSLGLYKAGQGASCEKGGHFGRMLGHPAFL